MPTQKRRPVRRLTRALKRRNPAPNTLWKSGDVVVSVTEVDGGFWCDFREGAGALNGKGIGMSTFLHAEEAAEHPSWRDERVAANFAMHWAWKEAPRGMKVPRTAFSFDAGKKLFVRELV